MAHTPTPRINQHGPRTVAETFNELSDILGGRWSRDLSGLAATFVRRCSAGVMVGHYDDVLIESYQDRVIIRAPRSYSSARRVARFSPINMRADSAFNGWRFTFGGVEYWTPRGTVELARISYTVTEVRGAITRADARKLGPAGRAAFRHAVWATVRVDGLQDWTALAGAPEMAAALINMTPRARDMVPALITNGLTPSDALACAPAVTA